MSLIATVYGQFHRRLSKEMTEVGFREVTVRELDLKPIPAVCVLARK